MAANEGIEFNLFAGCRPEDFITLDDDINNYIIAHLVLPCG
jgi:hypothetical protein